MLVLILLSFGMAWLAYMLVIPLGASLGDYEVPPLGELAWKVALLVVGTVGVEILLGLVWGPLGFIAGIALFFWALVAWFDVDFFGAMVIAIGGRVMKVLLALVVHQLGIL